MKCPRCQQVSPADADFCPECGAKLVLVCGSCGTANAPTHKFCKKCGQGLATDAVAGQPPARSNSPESYRPRHLAEKILTSKAALEGERKQVTVLFADLTQPEEDHRQGRRLATRHRVEEGAERLIGECGCRG